MAYRLSSSERKFVRGLRKACRTQRIRNRRATRQLLQLTGAIFGDDPVWPPWRERAFLALTVPVDKLRPLRDSRWSST